MPDAGRLLSPWSPWVLCGVGRKVGMGSGEHKDVFSSCSSRGGLFLTKISVIIIHPFGFSVEEYVGMTFPVFEKSQGRCTALYEKQMQLYMLYMNNLAPCMNPKALNMKNEQCKYAVSLVWAFKYQKTPILLCLQISD